MRKIARLIRRDALHVLANAITLVVCVGLVVVPSFYAWFNIAGSWDPYGNTKNLKVAVASSDAGYTSELLPVSFNMGERIVADLRESDTIGYVFTSEEDAVEGVRSGAYYAAIVIPEDFTSSIMDAFSGERDQAQVRFYQNEKRNAIASIVTDKASAAVQQDIDSSFAEAVTTAGAGVLDELAGLLDDDQVAGFASKLDAAVDEGASALADTADDVRGFSSLLASTESLLGTSSGAADSSLAATLDAGDALRETASGIAGTGDALDGAASSVADALAQGASGLDAVSDAIDQAFATAGSQAQGLEDALGRAADAVDAQVAKLQDLSDRLGGTDTLIETFERSYGTGEGNVSLDLTRIHEVRVTVQGLNDRVSQALSELRELSSQLRQTASDLKQGTGDAEAARQKLAGLVADAKAALSGAQSDYDANVRGSLQELAGSIESAASEADGIAQGIQSTMGAVDSAASEAASGLSGARDALDDTARSLDEAAERLSALHGQLSSALASGDLAQIRQILSAGPDALAAFVAAPVSVDRTALFPVENNGSAMTPFYTTLSIWIGGVVLCAIVRAVPSERALAETGCSHTQGYLGRIFFFVVMGLLQTTLICGGNLFYLGVQCAHPWLFFLAGWVASITFVNIIFALTASFGDVGKAIAVVLMVIQVAGSGGTFPREMLPGFFQTLYPLLPFVHAENALRAAMFGLYGADFWVELATLLVYVVAALLLGLVLRRPVIRLNEWVEHQLERSRVM